MKMVKVAAAIAMSVFTLGFAGAGDKPHVHSFSELPVGNVLTIHLQSSGCFHEDCYHFNFQRKPEASISVDTSQTDEKGPQVLPTLTLSDEDVKGLDNMLDFYR